MAVRYNKINLPNELYFVTFTIAGWKHIFINNRYCNLIYKWFDYLRSDYENQIYGYVIMPNHVHILIQLSEKSPLLPKLIQNAKRFLAYDIVRLLKEDKVNGEAREGALRYKKEELLNNFKGNLKKGSNAKHRIFKDKYNSLIIQSNRFFLEKLNYIHNNPCQEKWNLCDYPENYKYSSASNYITEKGNYEIGIMDF